MSFTPTDDQLNQARLHLREQELWMQQRETQQRLRQEVDNAIEKLDTEIYKARRSGENSDFKTESLQLLKKKRVELDRWLDQIEDTTEEDLISERNRLKQWILLRDPKQAVRWQEFEDTRQTIQEQQTTIHAFLSITHELKQFIERGLQESLSIRRGGFLRYIAGQNPNVVITACLSGAETVMATLLRKLQETPDFFPIEQFQLLAQNMAQRNHGRWKWSGLSTELKEELAQVNDLVNQLDKRLIILEQKQATLQQQVDKWLLNDE